VPRKLICYAIDRDETVETSNGPVPLSLIRKLVQEGHPVFAYGNRKLCDEVSIPYAEGRTKEERLRLLRQKIKADKYIVVDDAHISVEGWEYMSPHEFVKSPYGRSESNPRRRLEGVKAVIIAGGFGTRMAPITRAVPKPLLPLGNKPLIDFLVEKLEAAGVPKKDIYVTTSEYYKDAFEKWNSYQRVNVNYEPLVEVLYDASLLQGSLYALYALAERLGFPPTVVLFGNSFFEAEIPDWDKKGVAVSVYKVPASEAHRFGVVEEIRDGYIVKYREKPPINGEGNILVGASPFFFPSWVYPYLKEFLERKKGEFLRFGYFVSYLIEKGVPVRAILREGFFEHVDKPESYFRLWRWWLSSKSVTQK